MVDPGTILIVQIGKLGDMILTTPLFREIKRLFPDSALSVLASDLNKAIAQNDPHIDKVYVYKKNIQNYLHLYFSSLKKQDIWIDTKSNYSRTSALFLKIFKPKFSLGFNFTKPVFNIDMHDYVTGNHAVDLNLSPVIYFTNKNYALNKKPEIRIPEETKVKISSSVNQNTYLKNVVINISAGDESRYLQKEKWVEIIDRIGNKEKFCIYLTGLDKDRGIIDYIISGTKKYNVKYIKTENIMETAEVIRLSNITISPDTSIIHLCSAFNTPVIGIYPDVKWNLEKFYPLSDNKEIIISGNINNIDDVTPQQVVISFERLSKIIF